MSALLYNVVELTILYLNYPISVKLKVDHQHQLTFPSVTVCNMSPVKKSSLAVAQESTSTPTKRRKKRSSMTDSYCMHVSYRLSDCVAEGRSALMLGMYQKEGLGRERATVERRRWPTHSTGAQCAFICFEVNSLDFANI